MLKTPRSFPARIGTLMRAVAVALMVLATSAASPSRALAAPASESHASASVTTSGGLGGPWGNPWDSFTIAPTRGGDSLVPVDDRSRLAQRVVITPGTAHAAIRCAVATLPAHAVSRPRSAPRHHRRGLRAARRRRTTVTRPPRTQRDEVGNAPDASSRPESPGE